MLERSLNKSLRSSLMSGRRLPPKRGGQYLPETQALLSRMTVQPDTARKVLIDKTIRQLKADGIWELLGFLHIQAAHHSQAGLLDWTGNGYDCTAVNGPVFVPNMGFSTGASDSLVINSNYQFQNRNNFSLGCWVHYSEVGSRKAAIGELSGGDWFIGIIPSPVSAESRFYIEQTTAGYGVRITNTLTNCLFSASRLGVNKKAWINANNVYANASSPLSGETEARTLGYGRRLTGLHGLEISAGFAGAALTDAQHAALYATLNNYMQEVGNV